MVSLGKWLSVCLRTTWFWARVQLQSITFGFKLWAIAVPSGIVSNFFIGWLGFNSAEVWRHSTRSWCISSCKISRKSLMMQSSNYYMVMDNYFPFGSPKNNKNLKTYYHMNIIITPRSTKANFYNNCNSIEMIILMTMTIKLSLIQNTTILMSWIP